MIFQNYILQGDLKDHIESIFYLKDFTPDHSIERIVPTGHVFIIFEFDNILRNIFHNDTLKPLKTFSKVWISGTHRNYLSISAHQHSEMLGIQFKPAGAFPFLHRPVHELNDKVVAAKDIFGKEILELREEIHLAETPQTKFEIAANWLTNRFNTRKRPPSYLLTFVERLQKEPGSKLKNIIDSYPVTQKQLIEHFKKYVGLTPKYYHRILRFNEILKRINQKEQLSWTDIAYSCNYSDQSHFIKEFFLFSGFNPQEYLKMDFSKEQTNFFPLDKRG